MIVIMANFFLYATGANFANSYGALFIRRMDSVNPFTVTLSTSIGMAVLGLVTILVLDKLGRRLVHTIEEFSLQTNDD